MYYFAYATLTLLTGLMVRISGPELGSDISVELFHYVVLLCQALKRSLVT